MNEDKITDQATYLNRRTFMRVAALAGTATATTLLYRRLNPPPPFPVEGEKLNDVAKTNDANGFNTVEQLTAIEAITNYNNFYEFDTTKDGVASAAKGFVTRPWAVAVDGLVHKPKVFDIEELLKFPLEQRVYRLRCVEGWSMVILPALLSLLVVPWLLYWVFPPEIKHTPAASEFASKELKLMGPMKWSERLMLMVFGLVAILWITTKLHGIDYAVVAMLGISVLLVTGVLDWEDLISEKAAWAVFIWYGGLIRMAEALGQTGLTKQFAEAAAGLTTGWKWWLALASLLLIYFYAHYVFASITAHVTAMFVPFLIVILAAGTPVHLAVLSLAYFSNLGASLTHYGTTPAPIYFGAGYTTQRTWWTLGLITSVVTILIWSVIGFAWWKVLRLW